MKLLSFFIIILSVILVSCGLEEPTYTEAYEYLTIINCDGTEKIHLTDEDNPITVHFNSNNSKFIFERQDKIISFDLNSLQSEVIFPLSSEEISIFGYEVFQEFEKIIFWDQATERDLHVATIETGDVVNLTNTLEKKEDNAKLSPTEEYYVYIERDYVLEDSVKWSIIYRNFEGTINETIISKYQGNGPGEFYYVDWVSNDTLLYSDNDANINPGIYTINIDGSNKQYIFNGLYLDFNMCEDRTKVVFEHENEIYLLHTADYSVSHLVSGWKPVISPNGNKLAYYDGISGLVIWDMTENTISLISETPRSSASSFTSDSQKIVFNEQIIVTYDRFNE